MPARKKASNTAKNSSANLGFEAKLWLAADKLRNNMDAAEYKHVVLGLIFLKYISDTFEEHRAKLLAGEGDYEGADPEDPDEYKAENVFWVPSDARWPHLQAKAMEPSIGKTVDDAMVALERENIRLKGVLPKDYARPGLDKHRLGELIDLIATIELLGSSEPSPPAPLPEVEGSSSSLPLPVGEGWGEGRSTTDGMAGFVLANGSMSSNQSGEGEIRKALIEADLVDCMVALPGQLFYSTQIPVCLWFLTKSKAADAKRHFRDRRKETLFIDARKMGTLIDRVHRELTDADLEKITSTYHAWRGDGLTRSHEEHEVGIGQKNSSLRAFVTSCEYSDIPGFCKSATTAEIAAHGHVLTPGRYVGAEEIEDDGDPFEEKMPRLVAELNAQFAESAKLEAAIRKNLQGLGYAL